MRTIMEHSGALLSISGQVHGTQPNVTAHGGDHIRLAEPPAEPMLHPIRLAYLTSVYPKVSHTFIRREIAAMERLGHYVERYSIRHSDDELVDEADRLEAVRTRVLLDARTSILSAILWVVFTRPVAFFRAGLLAARISLRSERGIVRHLAYLAEACLLLRHLVMSRIDHLHVHIGENSATVAMLCGVLGGPRWSFTVHGPTEFDKPRQIALGEKIARAEFVVGISDYTKSQLMRHSREEDWGKINVVRCGLDQEYFDTPETPVPSAPRLVTVGRLCAQKAPTLLVEAAARLQEDGYDFELVMVGDGELRQRVDQLIEKHNLQSRVRVTGYLDAKRVREELEAARALVLPSFAEGLPVVIMEALALRRPVISTTIAGIPELVQPGSNGWLVPPSSIEALVQAMKEVLDASPETLLKAGRAGRQRVLANHDIANSAEELAQILERHRPTVSSSLAALVPVVALR